ncbi:endo alpha-1,4 polygalactosaminidase [Zooshikella sp. RANM57]|uniref:endo alpha-1,4 polygalactosaminidase n=1 Tax=Zooshikella sp. RANM57 TaxID=3425863 RepID=UPI003D6E2B19
MKNYKQTLYGGLIICMISTVCNAQSGKAYDDSDAVIITDSYDDIVGTPTKKWWQPKPGLTWWWQIENSDTMSTNIDADVVDIDLFDASEGGQNSKIRQFKKKGKKVVCYFSAGTYEKWRSDAKRFTKETLIPNGDMDDWPDETWLNIGDAKALVTIKSIIEDRIKLAKDAGCDAVEPDNVDGFENTSETKGYIKYEDQLKYNKWLASTAHKYQLAVALKNDIQQVEELVDDFDFAVNEQCFAYDNECVQYESTFLKKNKAVFSQEYGGSDGLSQSQYEKTACPYFKSQNIASLWKKSTSLDGKQVVICK